MSSGQANAEIMEDVCPTLTCLHEAPIICKSSGDAGDVVCYDPHAHGFVAKDCGGLCPTLTARAGTGGGNVPLVIVPDADGGDVTCYENHAHDCRVTDSGDLCPTLTARMGTGGGNVPLVMVPITPPVKYIVRRLLPLETERLMGFYDNWTKISWNGKSPEDCPDSYRYKCCGNSFCVNVIRWIGTRIQDIQSKLDGVLKQPK